MKKILLAVSTVALLSLSLQASAGNVKIGKKIYDRAFGRGCGACHDIASNPQLAKLIKSGDLKKSDFAKVLKEGKNGMPKAIKTIMAIKPVKKAKLTEQQAIDALWSFLSK